MKAQTVKVSYRSNTFQLKFADRFLPDFLVVFLNLLTRETEPVRLDVFLNKHVLLRNSTNLEELKKALKELKLPKFEYNEKKEVVSYNGPQII